MQRKVRWSVDWSETDNHRDYFTFLHILRRFGPAEVSSQN